MNRLLITLLALAGLITADAQHYDKSQAWLNIDTIPNPKTFTGRHALLEIDWNIQSNGSQLMGQELSELRAKHPTLTIILRHTPLRPIEKDPLLIKRYLDLYNIYEAVVVDTSSELSSSPHIPISFKLTTPDNTPIWTSKAWNPTNRVMLNEFLQDMRKDYNRPGRTLANSYLPRPQYSLSESLLLNDPQDMAWDSRFRRLFIADTGNDRIIICTEDGKVMECIGGLRSGSELASFDMSLLTSPNAVAYHEKTDQLYFAERGNARLVAANLNERNTYEPQIKDEDGFEITLPSAIGHMDIDAEFMTLCLPESRQVWTIDLSTFQIINTIGNLESEVGYNKKKARLGLQSPVLAIRKEGHTYVYDQAQQTLFQEVDNKVSVIYTADKGLWEDEGGILDETGAKVFSDISLSEEGMPRLLELESGTLWELDTESRVMRDVTWTESKDELGLMGAFLPVEDKSYFLDIEHGEVILIDGQVEDRLRISDVHRLYSPGMNKRELLPVDMTSILPDGQTSISLDFAVPEGLAFHPSHPSMIMKTAGTEIYMENDKLAEGPIKFIVMPGYKKNQVNLMAEIYLMEIGRPWRVYQKNFQISMPLAKDEEAEKHQLIQVPLLRPSLGD